MAKRELLAAVCVVMAVSMFMAIFAVPTQAKLDVRSSAVPDPIGKYGRNGTLGLNQWYTSAVTVWIIENGTVNYTVNDGEPQPYEGPIVLTENGTFRVVFVGYINETANETLSLDVKIDGVIPHTTSSYSTDSLKCTLNATDETSGVDKVMYRIDGGKWMNYYGPFRPKTGTHTVEYYSQDAAGNKEPSKNITFSVVFNVKSLELGLVVGALAIGLAAFFIVVLRARKSRSTEAPEEKPSRLE